MHPRRFRRFLVIGGASLVAVGIALALVLTHSGGGKGHEFENGVKKAAERVEGNKGGEAGREERYKSPSMEAVANRAYPRHYVDDRRGRKERKAVNRLPHTAPRKAFRTRRALAIARDTTPQHWDNLGPRTPNLAGQDSPVLDPSTLTGPATPAPTGRATALRP